MPRLNKYIASTGLCSRRKADELIAEGKSLVKNGFSEYTEAELDNEKMSVIIFTSGTTGANKGVMLSHKNIMTSRQYPYSPFIIHTSLI